MKRLSTTAGVIALGACGLILAAYHGSSPAVAQAAGGREGASRSTDTRPADGPLLGGPQSRPAGERRLGNRQFGRRDGLAPRIQGPLPEPPPGDETPQPPRDIMPFIHSHFPEVYAELERLRTTDPERFEQILQRYRERLIDLKEKWPRDPERGNRFKEEHAERMKLCQLARDYQATGADDPRRDEIKRQMRELVARQVDRRLDHLRRDIEHLQERLAEMKKELADNEQGKERLIDQEMEKAFERPAYGPPSPLHGGPGMRGGHGLRKPRSETDAPRQEPQQ